MDNHSFLNKLEAIERLGDDEEIYFDVLKTFAEAYHHNSLLQEMKIVKTHKADEVLSNLDLRLKASKEFHKIKGSALTVGADALGQIAKDLELFLKNETDDNAKIDFHIYEDLLSKFNSCYENTMKEISSLL